MCCASLQSTEPTAIRCVVLKGFPVILEDDASMFFKSSSVSKPFPYLYHSHITLSNTPPTVTTWKMPIHEHSQNGSNSLFTRPIIKLHWIIKIIIMNNSTQLIVDKLLLTWISSFCLISCRIFYWRRLHGYSSGNPLLWGQQSSSLIMKAHTKNLKQCASCLVLPTHLTCSTQSARKTLLPWFSR